MKVPRSYFLAMTVLMLSVTRAAAQLPPPTVVPPVPNLNPSSSLVLPPPHEVPLSPAPGGAGQLSLLHHHHSICSIFRRGPCFPHYLPSIGQDLRLTIVSNDEDASRTENAEVITADEHALDSIRDMFAALRACWVPPPKDEGQFDVHLEWLPYTLDIPSYLGSARLDQRGEVVESNRNAISGRRVRYSYTAD